MPKKIGAVLSIILMCSLLLSSCYFIEYDETTGVPPPNETETDADETAKIPPETFAPQINEGEQAQKKLEDTVKKLYTNELEKKTLSLAIISDEESPVTSDPNSVYSKVFAMQLKYIKEATGCEIGLTQSKVSTFIDEALSAKKAGVIYADILYIPQSSLGAIASAGLLYDLKELYGDALNASYLFESAANSSSVGGKLYGVAGNACFAPSSVACIAFNKTLTDKAGVTDDIYSAVKSGKWTVGLLSSVAGSARSDGIFRLGTDSEDGLTDMLFGGFGIDLIDNSGPVTPKLKTDDQRVDQAVKAIREIKGSGTDVYFANDSFEKFSKGNSVFYLGNLEEITKLSGNFGIVPLPLLESGSEYNSYTSPNAPVFAVLDTVVSTDHSFMMLQMLNGTGDVVYDLWIRELIDNVLSDSESAHNIRKILRNAKYSFNDMFGEVCPSLYRCTVEAVRESLKNNVSYYDTIKNYTAALNKELSALLAAVS